MYYMNMNIFEKDLSEIKRRIIKFVLYSILIHFIIINIPCRKLPLRDSTLITLSSCCIFILVDIHIPSVSINNNQNN